MAGPTRLERLEQMRRRFLTDVQQLLSDVPADEIKVEIAIYPEEPDLLRQFEKEAQYLEWVHGLNMGHRWYSSTDILSESDTGNVTVYL